jgi:26S proteasome regulatory subunit N3
LETAALQKAISGNLGDSEVSAALLAYVGGAAPMDADGATAAAPAGAAAKLETELFLQMIVVMRLIDGEKAAEAAECSRALVGKIRAAKTRTSTGDEIVAKCYFYFSRAFELLGKASSIRGELHSALRTATLRSDEPGQAMLLNLLLRNYLADNLIDQAQKLISKTVFPESSHNSESARHLFYIARIAAIQLDYSEAHRHVELAMRKAPKTAVGFLQTANKLGLIVQMLLGEIPDRDLFRQPDLKR